MKGFLKSKFATIILFTLFVVVLFATAKLLAQKRQIDKQIAELQERTDRIKGENQKLSDLVKYLSTPQYQEKEAREKLNLKKEGEFVVGLPHTDEQDESQQTQKSESNPEKWFNYFFKKS